VPITRGSTGRWVKSLICNTGLHRDGGWSNFLGLFLYMLSKAQVFLCIVFSFIDAETLASWFLNVSVSQNNAKSKE
jgi:hypothetical protein